MSFKPSSKAHPCRICGRNKDGDCRETDDGVWLCHTERNGVRKGQRHPSKPYIFCGKSDEAQGFGIWKPEASCSERPQKADRKVGTRYFNYQFWDGQPTPAQRYRKDFNDDRPKEVKWCKGGLGGRPQSHVAPYQWFEESPNATPEAPLFIVKGELKAELLTKLGLNAVSILDVSERLISELRRLNDAIVLAPDCDLADLGKWYKELTAALPEARHLLSPMRGLNWRNPPTNSGLGVEDWIATSKPTAGEIQQAITSKPWQPAQLAANAEDPAEELLMQQLGSGWYSNKDGKQCRTQLTAGDAVTLLEVLHEGFIRFNEVARCVEVNSVPLQSLELELLYTTMQKHGWMITKVNCFDAITTVALQNRFDPVREYLDDVANDDTLEQVDIGTIATNYLGTADPDFDAYMQVFLVSAVKRRYEPGSKCDTVVTLDGDGGIGKSEFWIALASPDWHSSSDAESDKDFLLNLHRSWIYEQAELDYLTSKRQVGQLKNLITTRQDDLRVPYGRGTEKLLRKGVMVGTVNGPFLRGDAALRRRFLVISCPQSFDAGDRIDLEKVCRDRDAIWKAAVIAYRNGVMPYLDSAAAAKASQKNLAIAEDEHPWTEPVIAWLSKPINADGPHTSNQILIGAGLVSPSMPPSRTDQMELAKAMQQVETPQGNTWRKDKLPTRHNGTKARFWRKVETVVETIG